MGCTKVSLSRVQGREGARLVKVLMGPTGGAYHTTKACAAAKRIAEVFRVVAEEDAALIGGYVKCQSRACKDGKGVS